MVDHDPSSVRQPARHAIWQLAALSFIAAFVATSLVIMGRVWWCEAGDLRPWSWDVWSRHNSQHLIDPYSLSHVEHGVGLCLILLLLLRKHASPLLVMLVVALVEAAWEVMENTQWMIERYRQATMSLSYYGDSILNSLSDYSVCVAGVVLAGRIPLWISAAVLVCLETVSVWWIRDSLVLNALMLLWPIEAVRQWQTGG
jgi:hypothetical protein